MVVFLLHTIEADHDLKGERFGAFFAQFDNSIGEKSVGGDVHPEGAQIPTREPNDIEQIRADKGFASSQSHSIQCWQLPIDRFDLFGGEVPFSGHLPRVAHDATGVATKSDSVSQHSGANRTTRAKFYRIGEKTRCSANCIDPSHIRETPLVCHA